MDDVMLFQGDCMKIMRGIPEKSIDMVLCDLPYGITPNWWDECLPFKELWNIYDRLIKDNGVVVLFGSMPFGAELISTAKGDLCFRYEWIWKKDITLGFLNANRMPMRVHENILVFYKNLPKYNPQFVKGKPYKRAREKERDTSNYGDFISEGIKVNETGDRYPIDVLEINKDKVCFGKGEVYHPTQKPVELLEYLIKTYTDKGDKVLDNCMGSGSTGVACINTEREFIGIELSKQYYGIAEKRIKEAREVKRNDT